MAYQLLIGAKASGEIYDVTASTIEIDLKFERKTTPSKLTFKWVKSGEASFFEGDIVRFQEDGETIFYGYVFTKEKNRWDEFTVTCYDRLRYLKANASYAFYGRTAAAIVQEIAEDLQLPTGTLADTGYEIPSLIKNNQSCLSIIQEAIDLTLINTGKLYALYDDGIGLALKAVENWKSDVVIGEKSYLTDYVYKTDIDEATYNSVKLSYQSDTEGKTEVIIVQDSSTIARWGMLQKYESVNGDYNTAQLQERAKQTLKNTNRRKRSLSVESLGVKGLRAGMLVRMYIPAMGDINLNQWVLIESIYHHYQEGVHTMSFETLEIS